MVRQVLTGLVVAGVVVSLSGCALVEPTRMMSRQVLRQFTPRADDRRDPTESVEDHWERETREAQAIHPADRDPDPWYRKSVMSEKARQIERHLNLE